MNLPLKLCCIMLAGGLGTLSRYGLYLATSKYTSGAFPWGTFSVNVLGCFLFGLVWAFGETKIEIPHDLRIIILVGFMGAFTTFSTFIHDSFDLMTMSQWFMAMANIFGQFTLGLIALSIGVMLVRLF